MLETAAGFDWDSGNLEKCQKHGVSVAEIERLFARPHAIGIDVEHSLTEERLRAIGKTDQGRYLFLVFTIRERNGERFILPISARYMHGQGVAHYEEENPDL